jgi:hypothetical protein
MKRIMPSFATSPPVPKQLDHQTMCTVASENAFCAIIIMQQKPCGTLDVPHDILETLGVLNGHQRSNLDVLLGGARGRLLVGLRLLLAGRDRVVIDVSASAVSSQMGVVDGGMQRDRSSGADVLVRVLKNELLQLGRQPLTLVENALVVDGASRTLDGDVGAQVEVELEGMGASSFNQSTRERVAVAVALTSLGEEADVMALASDDDGELGDLLAAQLLEALLHVADFLFKDSSVLA